MRRRSRVLNVAAIHAAASSPLAVARRLGLDVANASRSRRTVRVRCPWHEDYHPSCDLTEREGRVVAYCRSCGEGGDVLSLVAALEGLDPSRHFKEVAHAAADIFGVQLADDFAPVQRDPVVDLMMALDASADRWVAGRPLLALDERLLESASPSDLAQAHAALRAAGDRAAADRDRADLELDAVGDLLESRGALKASWWEP